MSAFKDPTQLEGDEVDEVGFEEQAPGLLIGLTIPTSCFVEK